MRLVDSKGGLVENDAELVRATRLHERAAANALFKRYHRRVMAYCVLASGGDRSRAQDLAQETFARAFLGLRRLRHPERFAAFLFTVARNVCLTRGAQESRLLLMEMLGAGVDVAAPEPEEHCLREDRISVVRELVAQVQDEMLRTIVTLRYCDPEHTTRQIAERLSIPHGTVCVKLMRFRSAVRRKFLKRLAGMEAS